MNLTLGVLAACAASFVFAYAIVLQASEARAVPVEHSLRPSLLARLARRRRWLGGTALGLVGWPLQVVALLLAPLTVVAAALASGLLLLLAFGSRMLGERPGRREVLATLAIVAGVAGMAAAAPDHTDAHAAASRLVPVLLVLAVLAVLPYVRGSGASALVMLSAGLAYAIGDLTTKFLADDLSAGGAGLVLLWAAATAGSAGLGLLSEMSALQRRPAQQVAPVMFVTQTVVPVLCAPLLGGESWRTSPVGPVGILALLAVVALAAGALASARPVAGLLRAAAE